MERRSEDGNRTGVVHKRANSFLLVKPSLKDFENYLASLQNECNCIVV